MRIIITLSSFLILLVSCSPSTVSPANTVTATSTVSPTKVPLSTLTPKPTASATLRVSETPSSTPDAASQILYSPNGKYVAKLYGPHNALEKPIIDIFDEHNKLLRQIPYQGKLPEGDPKPYLTIYQWSNDSSQLYFYYFWSPDGGDYAFWWTGYDLQKIDVKTGNIQQVLPGTGSMSFATSPDGTHIAYTRAQDEPSIIYIRDLATGAVKKAKVLPDSKTYVRVGDIRWSPSGNGVAFQTEADDYTVQTIYLDANNMEQKIIKEYFIFTFFFDGWIDNEKLQISQVSADGMRIDKVFQIDVATSEMIEIGTPTPRP